ncbi:hypothetical protein HMPREF2960_09885 [Corynebacterium sp. HMSC070B05]|nr:hypothetical protein HMPREF2960_09885 [Corynebacterium sp. HMSC070B05]
MHGTRFSLLGWHSQVWVQWGLGLSKEKCVFSGRVAVMLATAGQCELLTAFMSKMVRKMA